MARRERQVKVQVPGKEEDNPQLGRVGIIAATGFAIGVAWPWLAGVQLVPSAPTEEEPASAPAPSASAAPSGAPGVSGQPPAAEAPAASDEPERSQSEQVEVGEIIVLSCKDERGRRLDSCDKVPLDPVVRPRLEALAHCEAAQGASDKISVGLSLDFGKDRITKVTEGKSTTFSKATGKKVLACAKKELAEVSLDGVDHEHEEYLVYYIVQFIPPGRVVGDATEAAAEVTEASGMATVRWEVALVRSEPETGKVKARILFGTRVAVAGRRDDWFLIRYDAKNNEGWVHKNAIGM